MIKFPRYMIILQYGYKYEYFKVEAHYNNCIIPNKKKGFTLTFKIQLLLSIILNRLYRLCDYISLFKD